MSQGKRRRKAAAQQKQQRRVQQGLPPSEPPPDAFVPRRDEAAEELLTSRGWISLRGLGMDEEGDGWEWTPSQLPLSLVDGGEPVPTSVGELHAGGVIDEQELVADQLHYPYEEDPGDLHSPHSFRRVRRAQRLELVPTFLYKALVAARTS